MGTLANTCTEPLVISNMRLVLLPMCRYYGCDDCCHTSIAIEHNLGAGCKGAPNTAGLGVGSGEHYVGPGTASGCPGEYWALGKMNQTHALFRNKRDPYASVPSAIKTISMIMLDVAFDTCYMVCTVLTCPHE